MISRLSLRNTAGRVRTLYGQGRYQEALDICLQITGANPEISGAWGDAAVNCIQLGRWQDAVHYAQTALARGGNSLAIYDTLAHAHGRLGQWDAARHYGLQALNAKARQFSAAPVIPQPALGPLPPLPSPQTRERNIIAFSLFSDDSKYCETAVLNVQEQPTVYPHWICRFYVDGSVPGHVIERLRAGGAQIVSVEGPAAQWPEPMWRLLALQDPQAHRILFRDADAVISRREAAAVAQWLSSGQRFHMMRDWGSHTALMLAGLWAIVAGSLPPLEQLMARFLSAPLESRHFADQHFLRQYVWPYARASLMQHDSVFGFMDAAAFPEGKRSEYFHVGCMESVRFTAPSDLPDGTEVVWALNRNPGQPPANRVCAYPATVKEGALSAYIPMRYQQWIEKGTAHIHVTSGHAV